MNMDLCRTPGNGAAGTDGTFPITFSPPPDVDPVGRGPEFVSCDDYDPTCDYCAPEFGGAPPGPTFDDPGDYVDPCPFENPASCNYLPPPLPLPPPPDDPVEVIACEEGMTNSDPNNPFNPPEPTSCPATPAQPPKPPSNQTIMTAPGLPPGVTTDPLPWWTKILDGWTCLWLGDPGPIASPAPPITHDPGTSDSGDGQVQIGLPRTPIAPIADAVGGAAATATNAPDCIRHPWWGR
jgi:hypothetical protein